MTVPTEHLTAQADPAAVSAVPAMHRVGTAEVLAATASVRDGRVYDLGLPIDTSMPQAPPPVAVPFSLLFSATAERTPSGAPFGIAMDAVIGSIHTSTHLDGLAHVSHNGALFGGVDADKSRGDGGYRVHGIETVPPIVTRGIVLDIATLHGVGRLPDGYEVTVQDVEEALANLAVTVGHGDAVLIRTGKIQQYFTDPVAFEQAQPGIGPDAAIWLYERGMVILGTDTSGTEPIPYPERSTHVAMLVERGVHLIESLSLEEARLAAPPTGLFVCLPLKITGATGSWVRPILIT
jgi:kynurenine formamidase